MRVNRRHFIIIASEGTKRGGAINEITIQNNDIVIQAQTEPSAETCYMAAAILVICLNGAKFNVIPTRYRAIKDYLNEEIRQN